VLVGCATGALVGVEQLTTIRLNTTPITKNQKRLTLIETLLNFLRKLSYLLGESQAVLDVQFDGIAQALANFTNIA